MDADEVKQKIASQLKDCKVFVAGEGANYSVTVVGEIFRGLSRVKKQQLVYGCLAQDLSDGTIHALTIKAITPDQWQA
ncbi:MAG: cell division protein BolA [Gammaproteobacteria bacterium]|nr:MAG: cell division protein BolA [Gammaproteobacteria bacterium]